MTDHDHPKAEEDATFKWKKAEGQESWMKIGLSFLVFYFGEALLFWQGGPALGAPLAKLPLGIPLLYPLGFWSLFGVSIHLILRKNPSSARKSPVAKRFYRWQGRLLTSSITVGVVGVAFMVMRGSGNTTLGHMALFFAMFLAAAVIGSMELNAGWLLAAIVWLLTAFLLGGYPDSMSFIPHISDEDVLIGISTSLGFFLIGKFPKRFDAGLLDIPSRPGGVQTLEAPRSRSSEPWKPEGGGAERKHAGDK